MWIHPSVRSSLELQSQSHIVNQLWLSNPVSRFLLLLLVSLLLQLLVPFSACAEQLVAKIILNQEDKGDFFINRMENGDFLVKISDSEGHWFQVTNRNGFYDR